MSERVGQRGPALRGRNQTDCHSERSRFAGERRIPVFASGAELLRFFPRFAGSE